MQEIAVKAINRTLGDNTMLLKTRPENIAAVVRRSDCASAEGIDKQLENLQHELLKEAHNKEEYDTIADEIFRLRELKDKFTSDSFAGEQRLKRITDLQDFIAP